MRSALTLTTVSGIAIRVHASFLLILGFNAYQWADFGTRGALFGAVLSAFVFACVVLHELGHSLVAQAFGIPVTDITLYPIGGVARLAKRPSTPMQELLIAVAGPAVNVVIAAALALGGTYLFGLQPMLDALKLGHAQPPTGLTLWALLAASNVALAVFNMLPALPMDGGRVFRAMLSWPFGQRRATRIAALIGRAFAVVFVGAAFFTGNFMLVVIGVFLFVGAGAEVRDTEFQKLLDGVRASDAVNTQLPRLSPSNLVSEAISAALFWPAPAFAVERGGQFIGAVTREQLLASVHTDGGNTFISGLVNREVERVDGRASLEVARQRMASTGMVAVFDGDLFLGLLTEADLAHQLTVLEAFTRAAARGRRSRTTRSW